MKKNIIILTLLALFLCSCDKENNEPTENTENIENQGGEEKTGDTPDIEGSWKWHFTVAGGFIGIYNAEIYNPDCTLIFEEGNLMSIKDGEEYVIYQEEFEISKPDDIPLVKNTDDSAGDYLIELPEDVQDVINEYFANYNYQIFADGYVSISTENNMTMLNIINDPNPESEDCNYIGSHYVR